MAEADPAAGDPNAPREVDTDAPSEQQSKVRPTPIPTDRGWWDETAAAVKLPPLPQLPGAPPVAATPAGAPPPAPRPSVPVLSGRTPAEVSASGRPIPTLDPRPITAADLEDEGSPSLVASLAASKPTRAWVSVGIACAGVAFVGGLLLGRGTAPVKPPVPTPSAAASPLAPVVVPKATAAATPPSPPAAPANTVAEVSASASPAASAAPDSAKTAAPKPVLEPFNAKAARTNLSVAVARAQRCRDQTAPAGSVSAVVTFVPSGRVADVTVITPAYAGTHTGKCIVSKLKTAQVPPFSGEPETMKKTFALR